VLHTNIYQLYMYNPAVRQHTRTPSQGNMRVIIHAPAKKCTLCGKSVYKAEERTFEKDIFHGLCFGTWKKKRDLELLAKRNREYNKKPDVRCTDNAGDLNNKIYYDLEDN